MPKPISGLHSLTSTPTITQSSPNIFSARVRFIILDNKTNSKVFEEFGEWSSLGNIFFSTTDSPNPSKNFTTDSLAKPLFPNNKVYPLKNEIVYIISLPNNNIQEGINDTSYYYFQPINLWNSPHHNATPDPIGGEVTNPSQLQDYEETSAGLVRKVKDKSTEINLGNTFKEKLNIKSLQPFEGDIIYEGRWGQSLRLGSTIKNSPISNPWSEDSKNGDPITILRNNQYDDGKDPWFPQVENINLEGSSIYLTSTQTIPVKVSSKSYKSYPPSTSPIVPNQYSWEQIIINSGRLLFNSKTDSILLSSNKSINLNSIDSVNIDSPNTTIKSDEVLLGDKNATESVILGDKFLDDLSNLLTQLVKLGTALQTPIGTPQPYVPNASIPIPAVAITQIASKMVSKIENYKSKVSKTK